MSTHVNTTDLSSLSLSSSTATINANFHLLTNALDNVIWRDGSEEMNNHFDMNGYRIYNLGTPVNAADAVNKAYLEQYVLTTLSTITGGGSGSDLLAQQAYNLAQTAITTANSASASAVSATLIANAASTTAGSAASQATNAYNLASSVNTMVNTRVPLLPSSGAGALVGKIPQVQADGTWAFVLGAGGGTSNYFNRYPSQTSGFRAWSGLAVDGITGEVYDANYREVWLDDFYYSDADTDTTAFNNFAAKVNDGTLGDVKLKVRGGKGRGPSGRYLVDSEIYFNAGSRVVLDFGEATIRYTTSASRFHYDAPQVTGSSSTTPVSFFVMENGVHQYAAAIDCIGYWNFKYIPSRDMGTGYARNIRVYPQDNNNAAHTCQNTFRTKNTWYFHVDNCHVKGPPRTMGSIFANAALIKQEGLCVVTTVNACEVEFMDSAIVPGIAPLVAVDGTFTTGSYTRGKGLKQGANVAWFGRNDGVGGRTYSLYDEVGTLTTGAADLLDISGNVIGSFNITGVTRYNQLSEAIQIGEGTTVIASNYLINATSPDPVNVKWLNWVLMDMHCSTYNSIIKVDGISALQFGGGFECQPHTGSTGSTVLFDINHCDGLNMAGIFATTGDLPNMTFLKLRNCTAGSMTDNTLYFFKYAVDFDNTVKSFKVANNSAYELTTTNNPTVTTFLNSGKRYNGVNTRGIVFKSNGLMGVGFDADDNRRLSFTSTLTASSGSPTATVNYAYSNVHNGVWTYLIKATVSSVGSAAGSMYLSFPTNGLLPFGVPDTALVDHVATGKVTNWTVNPIFNSALKRWEISDVAPGTNSTSPNAWQVGNVNIGVPFPVFISGSVPLEYD